MKNIITTAAIFLLSVSSAFAAGVKVEVPAVHCQMCVESLVGEFQKNEAVKKADVDLNTKTLSLEFKEGKTLDDKTIQKTVKAAGYDAGKIARH